MPRVQIEDAEKYESAVALLAQHGYDVRTWDSIKTIAVWRWELIVLLDAGLISPDQVPSSCKDLLGKEHVY